MTTSKTEQNVSNLPSMTWLLGAINPLSSTVASVWWWLRVVGAVLEGTTVEAVVVVVLGTEEEGNTWHWDISGLK